MEFRIKSTATNNICYVIIIALAPVVTQKKYLRTYCMYIAISKMSKNLILAQLSYSPKFHYSLYSNECNRFLKHVHATTPCFLCPESQNVCVQN